MVVIQFDQGSFVYQSLRNVFIGFEKVARKACQIIVKAEVPIMIAPEVMKIRSERLVW